MVLLRIKGLVLRMTMSRKGECILFSLMSELIVLPQQPGQDQVHDGIVLSNMILHRGPGESQFERGLELPDRGGPVGVNIFYGLGLVKYNDIKTDLLELVDVPVDQAVSG